MTTNRDQIRLSDYALSEYKSPSFFVEKQFPNVYLEDGPELVELVKAYYRFLETQTNQSVYNNRRMYEYRNIDATLDSMLVFFKNKFLNGLFFDNDQRFIVKNILDLYRRKGSKEGIELFFRLFFESEVSVYYPSEDMFKPSTSTWKVGSFIQLYGVDDITVFRDIVNRKIYGDKSKASAFVDNVYFINVNKQIIPIIFISDVVGRFIGFDSIYAINPDVTYGRVYGSMRRVTVNRDTVNGTANNKVGDIVEIRSSNGYGAKGRVSKVTDSLSGQINFQIINGEYGYTVENTVISLSNQTLFFSDQAFPSGNPFIVGERVQQTNASSLNVIGRIVGKKSNAIGVELDTTQPSANTASYMFDGALQVSTIDRDANITATPIFTTEPNYTAKAEIGTITDTETVTIVTDLVADFVDVPLNSLNFSEMPPADRPMSGTRVNGVIPTISTKLNEAFVPETFVLGSIGTLDDINAGDNYSTDVFVLAEDTIFAPFRLNDQILSIVQSPGINIFKDDEITQTRQVKTFEGDVVNVTVRGLVVNVVGNVLYVKQLSYYSFIIDEPIFKVGSNVPITVTSRSRDTNSLPFGLNANITGEVESVIGRILEVEVFDSGFGYEDGGAVEFFNVTRAQRLSSNNAIDGTGIGYARDQGVTEGKWTTFFSHIDQEKVIQDSFFYQDYSYEITTDVSPSVYEPEYREIMHPSGLKLFTRFSKSDSINIDVTILDPIVSVYVIDESTTITTEDNIDVSTQTDSDIRINQVIEV